MKIKTILCFLLFLNLFSNLQAQSGYNFSQLHYNGRLINPAYIADPEALTFQASYKGIVGGKALVGSPQNYNFNIFKSLSDNSDWTLGGQLEFETLSPLGIFKLQPSLSRSFKLGEGNISVGASLGLRYFDFDLIDNGSFVSPQDIFSTNLGLGIYYQAPRYFASISAPNLINVAFTSDPETNILLDEQPFIGHVGTWFQLLDLVKIKTSVLLQLSNFAPLEGNLSPTTVMKKEAGANLNLIFDDRYWFGIGYGAINNETGRAGLDYQYLNFSVVYSFNVARLSYTYQRLLSDFNLSINTDHVIVLEFDLLDEGREKLVRYF